MLTSAPTRPFRTMLSVHELNKRFPRRLGLRARLRAPFARAPFTTALDAVDLELAPGRVLGLLGPNGAGKTTLIKILMQLVHPDGGTVRVGGADIRAEPRAAKEPLGWVHCDERSFLWRLSGLDNLLFFAALLEVPRRTALERIGSYLDLFQMRPKASDRFSTYSTGQKKIFAVIRGLLNDPRLVLMDEPTNSLDPIAARKLKQHVRDELVGERGCAVLWATHRLEEVHEVCDDVAVLSPGRVLFRGAVGEFAALVGEETATAEGLEAVFGRLVS